MDRHCTCRPGEKMLVLLARNRQFQSAIRICRHLWRCDFPRLDPLIVALALQPNDLVIRTHETSKWGDRLAPTSFASEEVSGLLVGEAGPDARCVCLTEQPPGRWLKGVGLSV